MKLCVNTQRLCILFSIISVHHVINGIRLVRLDVPNKVDYGDNIQLNCYYDLQNETLNAVKWYKDKYEFYRYVPRHRPPVQWSPLQGVEVDLDRSGMSSVYLKNITFATAGHYSCEVSTRGPRFATIIETKNMSVVLNMGSGPRIDGFQYGPYELDSLVELNCTSGPNKQPRKLTWFINGQSAPSACVRRTSTSLQDQEYYTWFTIIGDFSDKYFYISKVLRIMSVKTIPSYTIRTMQLSDSEEVREILTLVDLPHHPNEIKLMIITDPEGTVVAQDITTGKLLGYCSILNLSSELSYVFVYAVRPECQGLGIGTALWDKAMKRVGDRNITLQASEPKVIDIYKNRQNFTLIPERRLVIASGKPVVNALMASITGICLVDMNDKNIADVIEYDKQVCDGLDRSVMLTALNGRFETTSLVAIKHSNQVMGYCVIFELLSGSLFVIPLYADNQQIAELLLGKCLQRIPNWETKEITLSYWDSNPESIEVVNKLGLKPMHELQAMFTKKIIDGQLHKIIMCEKTMPSYTIRTMQLSDYNEVREILTLVDLPQHSNEIEMMFITDPEGTVVAQDITTSKLLGYCGILNLSPELSYVFVYAVRPECQGLGIGTALWDKAMKRVGDRNITLQASEPKVIDIYKNRQKFTLIPDRRLVIASGKPVINALTASIRGISLVDMNDKNIADVIEYDKQVCDGLDRTVQLRALAIQFKTTNLVAINDSNQVMGYCLILEFLSGTLFVAPLYADNQQIAELLLKNCLQRIPNWETKEITLSYWDSNPESIEITNKLELKPLYELQAMFTKKIIDGQLHKILNKNKELKYPDNRFYLIDHQTCSFKLAVECPELCTPVESIADLFVVFNHIRDIAIIDVDNRYAINSSDQIVDHRFTGHNESPSLGNKTKIIDVLSDNSTFRINNKINVNLITHFPHKIQMLSRFVDYRHKVVQQLNDHSPHHLFTIINGHNTYAIKRPVECPELCTPVESIADLFVVFNHIRDILIIHVNQTYAANTSRQCVDHSDVLSDNCSLGISC
ncbi:unnamed protein product [Medioppia subpectinata]|uniref:N-acetyltransferase domain-containing protein n=1 Tax=Medioppia subpectinata TaxID=1979941 RepID=A0A7R9PVT6_9ACAR|nr:unnamed protein product [Medioppia subpectinata]CAG2103008.1 unnamed protein product [Medioppia subpectinata]